MKYFMIGGDTKEYGPVDAELLLKWVHENRANGETLLRLEGETEWKPLRTFPDFQDQFGREAIPSQSAAPPSDPYDVPVLVGHSFARAWHLVGQHFGTIAAATFMVWLLFTVMLYLPCLGSILAMFLYGPLFGGLYMLFIKLIREGDASPTDIFTLTRDAAMPLMLTGFVSMLLTQIAALCCCLPGLYVQIAWLLSLPLVADRGLGFWDALETSRRVVTRHWFKVFALFILAFLPFAVFHFYLLARESADMSPHLQQLMDVIREMFSGGQPNQAEIQRIASEIDQVERSYTLWRLIRQCLLLISLPFGIGSLAFVYEDLFGRKK